MIKILFALFTLLSAVQAHKHSEKQPLVYGVFNEECFAKLSSEDGVNQFLNDATCLKFTASKFVGYLIVLGAVVVKVPQILKILVNCSTKGINPISYYVETTTYI